MSNATFTAFDQNELLTLAMRASALGQHSDSITYLKEATSRPDATAKAHYFLGAEYAEIQMYESAAMEMEVAVYKDPSLSIARLQLGMLQIGSANIERSETILRPLSILDTTNPLRYFGEGLLLLARNDLVGAKAQLIKGMELNKVNPALNGDMQRVIQEIDRRAIEVPQARLGVSLEASAASEYAGANHFFLSAYTSGKSH